MKNFSLYIILIAQILTPNRKQTFTVFCMPQSFLTGNFFYLTTFFLLKKISFYMLYYKSLKRFNHICNFQLLKSPQL
jgi:hypothetical protein